MGRTVPCQHCHGSGTIMREVKPGKWERVTCPACGGRGRHNIGTI